MQPQYARTSNRLDAALEQLVRERVRSNELIFQWTADRNDGCVTVCLIEEDIFRENEQLSKTMGGLCAGGGRSLIYRRDASNWHFVEESEWVS